MTEWPGENPYDDIGAVINSIITDVKSRQRWKDKDDGGRPGAVIVIPPGDYHLRTQAVIDISYLRIEGSGHGFTSSSIRYNIPPQEREDLHELWPGGSRILVDLPPARGGEQAAAFLVTREGSPRLSSVEFSGFCIDGLHFEPDGVSENPENSYQNGKTGIYVKDPNDSFRISQMGLVYLEHAITIRKADALSIHDNFIAECGNCIELLDWGQASKVTDNLVGAGPRGHSVYAENHGGLLIATNNIFPRGDSSVHLSGVTRSLVSTNRLHSFYPGVLILADDSAENLVEGNHLLRDHEPWTPFLEVTNGRSDSYGIIHVEGSDNTIVNNHVSISVDSSASATGPEIVGVRLASGQGNYVSATHVVAHDVARSSGESAFEAQVNALLSSADLPTLDVITISVDRASIKNTVLDSGTEKEVAMDRSTNAFRPTPRLSTV
ncbi:NosD domain-containing protein [Actinomyces oris]|uniref:NosD domain-containing protein n=1 Tax=Actinomyces oris TaxID=544580 RepID=UPI001C4D0E71|nr:NosD domain-containing protein [Actinomyces oris]